MQQNIAFSILQREWEMSMADIRALRLIGWLFAMATMFVCYMAGLTVSAHRDVAPPQSIQDGGTNGNATMLVRRGT
jgi:hypothetical protein